MIWVFNQWRLECCRCTRAAPQASRSVPAGLTYLLPAGPHQLLQLPGALAAAMWPPAELALGPTSLPLQTSAAQHCPQVRTSCCNFLGFRSSVIRSLNVTTSYSATLVNGTVVSNLTVAQENTTWYNGQMVVEFGRSDQPVRGWQRSCWCCRGGCCRCCRVAWTFRVSCTC